MDGEDSSPDCREPQHGTKREPSRRPDAVDERAADETEQEGGEQAREEQAAQVERGVRAPARDDKQRGKQHILRRLHRQAGRIEDNAIRTPNTVFHQAPTPGAGEPASHEIIVN